MSTCLQSSDLYVYVSKCERTPSCFHTRTCPVCEIRFLPDCAVYHCLIQHNVNHITNRIPKHSLKPCVKSSVTCSKICSCIFLENEGNHEKRPPEIFLVSSRRKFVPIERFISLFSYAFVCS